MEFNDIIKRLPHDLCFEIADYLYFEDLLRVRLVSRSWYQAFCKTDICAHAIRKQTSYPLENFFKKFGVNYAELDDEKKGDCLRKFMINRIRREHGIASSIFELEYDFTGLHVDFFHYSDGRIAIFCHEIIIVEDLNTRQLSAFEYPPNATHRTAGTTRLVGQFLISSFIDDEEDEQLVIWNVVSRRMHLIPITEVIFSATSYDNQVGLVVTDPDDSGNELFVLTWNEEDGLEIQWGIHKFDDPKDCKECNLYARIFFHPSKKGVVFLTILTRLLTKYDSSTYGTRITVYCFEDSRLISTQQEIIKTKILPSGYDTFLHSNENQISFLALEPPFGWIAPKLKNSIFVKQTLDTDEGPEVRWLPVRQSENEAPLVQEPPFDQEQLPAENQQSNVRQESYVRWIERPNGFVPLLQQRISSDETLYDHLIYDMSTKRFTHFKVPLHHTYQESLFSHGSLIWNDQVLIRACHENVEKLQVITLSKGLSGLWSGSMGNNDSSHSSRSSIMCGENRSSCHSSPYEFQDGLQENFGVKVTGDDNFVVLK
ncbi:hypothetical protein EPUL_004209, partial [Erysiphe pulchra]